MRMNLAYIILRQSKAAGHFSIDVADGLMHHINARRIGPQVSIRLAHRGVLWRLMLQPDLTFGGYYMDGDLQIESGTIDDLMALLIANDNQWNKHWFARLVLACDTHLFWISSCNFPGQSKRNVANHYDLTDSLFDTFLAPWRQYSGAYFRSPDDTLTEAQITIVARIAAKLQLQPNDKILDLGCGWAD